MKTYLVGGAVRDALLGRPVTERDWVVVGATPEQMTQAGFRPVGKDFPVFLHPATGEEYALARTERKTGKGYHGFVFNADPTVTLEADLARRDLTVNAMARDPQGRLIDPYGGLADLQARRLRHVSPAFAEDPVRILRVARFAARYDCLGFTIATDTLALMRQMVAAGEVDALVPERVWQELRKAYDEPAPWAFLQTLERCGARAILFPERPPTPAGAYGALHCAIGRSEAAAAEVRFAATFASARPHAVDEATIRALCTRLRAPNSFRDLTLLTASEAQMIEHALDLPASETVDLLRRCDAFRRPERFHQLVHAAYLVARCPDTAEAVELAPSATWQPARWLREALTAAADIDAQAIAERHPRGPDVARAIDAARADRIAEHRARFVPAK